MNKLVHIILLFLLFVGSVRAQQGTPVDYWDDVDFSDTSLVASKALQDKMIGYFYSFTDGDEKRFDSLSIAGLGASSYGYSLSVFLFCVSRPWLEYCTADIISYGQGNNDHPSFS